MSTKPIELKDIDVKQVEMVAKLGVDDHWMSEFFGVPIKSWLRWKASNATFRAALKAWEHEAVTVAERKLFERAIGYNHKEMKVFYDKDLGKCVTHEVTKHYPPSEKALSMFLTNMAPDKWQEKKVVEASVSTNIAERLSKARKRAKVDAATVEDMEDFLK